MASAETHPIDDLRRIRGIGDATEARLHVAGIETYAQLADTTVPELRALGFEARQPLADWIAQARELAGRQAEDAPAQEPAVGGSLAISSVDPAAAGAEHLRAGSTFTTRVVLDLTQVAADRPLGYGLSVFGRSLTDGGRRLLGERCGTLAAGDDASAVLDVDASPLAAGTYELRAFAVLHPEGERDRGSVAAWRAHGPVLVS